MSTAEKLEIAVKALERILLIDGWGLDMSPPGPCYEVADKALREIFTKHRKETSHGI